MIYGHSLTYMVYDGKNRNMIFMQNPVFSYNTWKIKYYAFIYYLNTVRYLYLIGFLIFKKIISFKGYYLEFIGYCSMRKFVKKKCVI